MKVAETRLKITSEQTLKMKVASEKFGIDLKCNSSPDKKIPLFLHHTNCILHNTIHTVPWCKYL